MDEVLEGEILGPEETEEKERKVRSGFWKTFRKAARYVPFSDELVAAYFCAIDPKTPHRVRGVMLAALAYFVLPIDALPDILAGIGFTDDVTVLLAAMAVVRAHITPAHRAAAERALDEHGPR